MLAKFITGFMLSLWSLFSHALAPGDAFAPPPSDGTLQFVQGRLLVRVRIGQDLTGMDEIAKAVGAKNIKSYSFISGLRVYQFDASLDVLEIMKTFSANQAVIYAEPDYVYRVADADTITVSDPEFPKLWGLENTGQTGGLADADINAQSMWAIGRGSHDIVIGIIDTGMDYTHPDLRDNVWTNANEIPGNDRDDDNNGYVDDIHGANAINSRGDPMDDNMHGTHVAGTIGASDNDVGVVGIAHRVRLAACKFLSSTGSGSISDALDCLEYFANLKSRSANPVNLIATNNSWGGGGRSQAMLDAIKEHHRLGILFIAAAGNDGRNNDSSGSYPANYDVPNVISVAATDHNDLLASFSNYGKRTVHVAAPGVKILSTTLNHGYGLLSGTSMATPHVTGLAAVISSRFRDLDHIGIKNLILTGGQRIAATKDTTISGRRIRGADINGIGSLTCDQQTVIKRLEPAGKTHRLVLGRSLKLSATHINCASSTLPLTVYRGQEGDITLYDDGQNGDLTAGDGIFSLTWIPAKVGTYELSFGEGDELKVEVYEQRGGGGYEVAQTRH